MLVSTLAITAVVALAVVGWRAVRGDDDAVEIGGPGTWNELVLVNGTSGEVVTLDGDGVEIGTHVGLGRVTEIHTLGERMALVGTDQIVLTSADETEPITVPFDRAATVTRLAIADQMIFAIGHETGGNLTIVNGVTGDVLDVGALAGQDNPLLFAETLRHDAAGTRFAAGDAANFQTILVTSNGTAPVFYPAVPVGVGEQIVATSQVVGQNANIGLFDAEGKNLTLVPTQIPAGAVIDEERVIMLSIDGEVSRIDRDDSEPTRLGIVSVPPNGSVQWVRPSFDGQRLVIFAGASQSVIELDGTTLFTTTFTEPVTATIPDPSWSCLAIGGEGGYHSLISLETGEQLADLTGFEVTGTARDGCTVIGERAGLTQVITTDGVVPIGRVRDADLGPDGRTVVRRTTTGDTELLRIDSDLKLEPPIDLGESAASNLVVAFLDR
jgi:hypothetical protein